MEAEYMTAYAAIQEVVWIRGVMTELGLKGFQLSKDASPTILNTDSKGAIDTEPYQPQEVRAYPNQVSLDS